MEEKSINLHIWITRKHQFSTRPENAINFHLSLPFCAAAAVVELESMINLNFLEFKYWFKLPNRHLVNLLFKMLFLSRSDEKPIYIPSTELFQSESNSSCPENPQNSIKLQFEFPVVKTKCEINGNEFSEKLWGKFSTHLFFFGNCLWRKV